MTYQPKPMLPSDLRDYTAPNWWRSNAHLVWAGVFAALVAWHVVNEITINEGSLPARQRVGADVASASGPSPSLDCLRLVRGQWLYGAIRHAGDIEPLRAECFYGYGATRFIQ